MATAKIYLDTRRVSAGSEKPVRLKISINHRNSTGYINLNIPLLPSQWDIKERIIINHPQRVMLNAKIAKLYGDVNAILFKLSQSEPIETWTNSELCQRIKEEMGFEPKKSVKAEAPKHDAKAVKYWFEKWMGHKSGQTYILYKSTRNRILAHLGEEGYAKLHFEDINRDWLLDFDDFMAQTAPSANSRAIHMRNLRTVCNYAIDNEVTTHYPFRRFKIEQETTRKRNLDIAVLRRLFAHQCDQEWQQRYLDAFKLSFMLIGINMVDLCKLVESTKKI